MSVASRLYSQEGLNRTRVSVTKIQFVMSPFAHICYDLDAHLLSKDNAYMSCMQVGETRGEVAL